MLVAHLPAGYIVTKYLLEKYSEQLAGREKDYFFLGLIFSVIPDLDLFYFYFVDSSVHHHKYFPHLPIFWVCVIGLLISVGAVFKSERLFSVTILLGANILVHLVLDSFVGSVWWLYPWLDKPFYLLEIPARFSHWMISFVLHWTFLVELVICLLAMRLGLGRYKVKGG